MSKHIITLLLMVCLFGSTTQAQSSQTPQAYSAAHFKEVTTEGSSPLQKAVNKPVVHTSPLPFSTNATIDLEWEGTKNEQAFKALQRARALWQKEQTEAALLVLEVTENKLETEQDTELLIKIYQLSANIYEHEGDFSKALYYKKQQVQAQQALMADAGRTVSLRNSADETARINVLQEETALRSRQLGLAILGGSVLFIFALLLYKQSLQNRRLAEELELRVQQRTKDLEDSNQALQRFAYIASHDLKTPLRTIVSLLSLIRKKIKNFKDLELEELMRMTSAGATRMTSMIDSLLTFARVNSSIQPMEHQEISLEAVVESIRENLGNIAINKPLRILSSSLPVVSGNEVKLYQLFQNLITNGLKYNNSTQPTIEVKARPQPGGFHLIQVADNGIGIDAEFHDSVFEMFTRLHSSFDYEGTGIGLALSKLIVEQHGGNIWIEANPSGGTIFCFTLPKSASVKLN
ncbi:MAG: ATP-binding protein [Bacteroidota bacterium]